MEGLTCTGIRHTGTTGTSRCSANISTPALNLCRFPAPFSSALGMTAAAACLAFKAPNPYLPVPSSYLHTHRHHRHVQLLSQQRHPRLKPLQAPSRGAGALWEDENGSGSLGAAAGLHLQQGIHLAGRETGKGIGLTDSGQKRATVSLVAAAGRQWCGTREMLQGALQMARQPFVLQTPRGRREVNSVNLFSTCLKPCLFVHRLGGPAATPSNRLPSPTPNPKPYQPFPMSDTPRTSCCVIPFLLMGTTCI